MSSFSMAPPMCWSDWPRWSYKIHFYHMINDILQSHSKLLGSEGLASLVPEFSFQDFKRWEKAWNTEEEDASQATQMEHDGTWRESLQRTCCGPGASTTNINYDKIAMAPRNIHWMRDWFEEGVQCFWFPLIWLICRFAACWAQISSWIKMAYILHLTGRAGLCCLGISQASIHWQGGLLWQAGAT